MKKYALAIFVFFLGIILGLGLFFFLYGFGGSFSGSLVLENHPLKGRGVFSFPWPPERVEVLSSSSFKVRQAPIFIFFFPPREFNQASLEIISSSQDYMLGILVSRYPQDVYKYFPAGPQPLKIDLSEAYYDHQKHRYGLVLSSSSTPLEITSLKIKLWSPKK